ncbi:MAG TPA: DUF86 domain-containing protein [Thermoanaerobaculia bacterium]|jgi:uncharacterized protein YutE (UPF0331/DUF86 family)|nr:DUF86 domain-containing protein [Thermoanaerobaculia bacterium]
MVRRDVAGRKIARARSWLDRAEARAAVPIEDFLSDTDGRDLVTFHLYLAIQEAIDLAMHWVVDSGIQPPGDVGSAFDILADQGWIDRDLAERMRSAVGLRNRIAHGYAEVNHERLHAEMVDGVETVRRFLIEVSEAAGL